MNKTSNIKKPSAESTVSGPPTTSMHRLPLNGNPSRQKRRPVALTTRLALLDFLNKIARLSYTLATKLVFVARDLTICIMAVIHSAVLIPLDFLLIFFYSGAAFVQKDVLAKHRQKWTSSPAAQTAASQTSRVSSAPGLKSTEPVNLEEGQRLFEAHFVRMNELNEIRARFWAGDAVSLRSLVLSTRKNPAQKPPVEALTPVSRVHSLPQLHVHSESKNTLYFCVKK